MDQVKNKINILFTTSYVIILGLAIPTVTNASVTPQCVSTSQTEASSTPESSTLGSTVKVVTIDVNISKKNNQNSYSALNSVESFEFCNQFFVASSSTLYTNRLRKSDLLRQLGTVKLLN